MSSDSYGFYRGHQPAPISAPPTASEAPVRPDITNRQQARQSGYTGDQCATCNSMRMRIAGHCMVCEACGTSSGCS